METIPRKSSIGKSSLVDNSINLLNDIIYSKGDMEDISTLVINNNLPNELRSIIWRIFLKIIPNGINTEEWVKITNEHRQHFQIVSKDQDIEKLIKIIRKESNDEQNLSNGQLFADYESAKDALDKISSNYDFFKSQIVAETLLRIFLIWRKSNLDLDAKQIYLAFYILAGVIYSLYPSIIHFTTEQKDINSPADINPKSLFYFLNSEEHFDDDVYSIFDNLMNHKGLKNLINSISTNDRQPLSAIQEQIVSREELDKEFISKLNHFERVSYYFLKVSKPDILVELFSKNVDIYDVNVLFISSLLTSFVGFENIVYFWDNIFVNASEEKLEFLDFVSLAFISETSKNSQSIEHLIAYSKNLVRYPASQEIVKKAFKIREKVSEYSL